MNLSIYDNSSGGTSMSAFIEVFGPAPGTEGFSLNYKLNGPFVDLSTRSDLTGFPTEEEAVMHGLKLFYVHISFIRQHPLFQRGNARMGGTTMARFTRGDLEAEAEMYWSGDDGWGWRVHWWWPGKDMNVQNHLNRYDPVAAYVEMRALFLKIVKQLGGNAYEIETVQSPFAEGAELPALPAPYQEVGVMRPEELAALRSQVDDELVEFQARLAAGEVTDPNQDEDGIEKEVIEIDHTTEDRVRIRGDLEVWTQPPRTGKLGGEFPE